MPSYSEDISVKVKDLAGGRWVVKLQGDFSPDTGEVNKREPETWLPFGVSHELGTKQRRLDKRVRSHLILGKPLVDFQIGIEGAPGAYVIFSDIHFSYE